MEYAFQDELERFEEQLKMPYITSIERIGLARGRAEGRVETLRASILSVARARWGPGLEEWVEKLEAIGDCDQLQELLEQVAIADNPQKVRFSNR